MTELEIDVHIEQKLNVPLDEGWFRNIVCKTVEIEGIASPVEIGLVITDAETVQELNKTYRGKDEPTDVLAFHLPAYNGGQDSSSFITPPDGTHHLGEVIISYPQAIQQAQEQGHHVEQELALLTIHGVLHLLGYDHEEPEEKQRMGAKEQEILEKLDFIESGR